MSAKSYQGVALLAPVSFGYERFSDHDAAWFIGSSLSAMIKQAGLQKADIDGLAVASFSMGFPIALSAWQNTLVCGSTGWNSCPTAATPGLWPFGVQHEPCRLEMPR